MPYEFPPLRQGKSSHIGFVFYLRLRLSVCVYFFFFFRYSSLQFAFTNSFAIAFQIVIHTRTHGFDFGNFIFCVGRRMRGFQPKGNRKQKKKKIKRRPILFLPLVCVCAHNFGKRCQCEKREPYKISVYHLQTRHAHTSYTRTHQTSTRFHLSVTQCAINQMRKLFTNVIY